MLVYIFSEHQFFWIIPVFLSKLFFIPSQTVIYPDLSVQPLDSSVATVVTAPSIPDPVLTVSQTVIYPDLSVRPLDSPLATVVAAPSVPDSVLHVSSQRPFKAIDEYLTAAPSNRLNIVSKPAVATNFTKMADGVVKLSNFLDAPLPDNLTSLVYTNAQLLDTEPYGTAGWFISSIVLCILFFFCLLYIIKLKQAQLLGIFQNLTGNNQAPTHQSTELSESGVVNKNIETGRNEFDQPHQNDSLDVPDLESSADQHIVMDNGIADNGCPFFENFSVSRRNEGISASQQQTPIPTRTQFNSTRISTHSSTPIPKTPQNVVVATVVSVPATPAETLVDVPCTAIPGIHVNWSMNRNVELSFTQSLPRSPFYDFMGENPNLLQALAVFFASENGETFPTYKDLEQSYNGLVYTGAGWSTLNQIYKLYHSRSLDPDLCEFLFSPHASESQLLKVFRSENCNLFISTLNAGMVTPCRGKRRLLKRDVRFDGPNYVNKTTSPTVDVLDEDDGVVNTFSVLKKLTRSGIGFSTSTTLNL